MPRVKSLQTGARDRNPVAALAAIEADVPSLPEFGLQH